MGVRSLGEECGLYPESHGKFISGGRGREGWYPRLAFCFQRPTLKGEKSETEKRVQELLQKSKTKMGIEVWRRGKNEK